MSQYSKAAQVVWAIAAAEAQAVGSANIENEHVFVGLCKIEDVTDPSLLKNFPFSEAAIGELQAEVRDFVARMESAGTSCKKARRRLRQLLVMDADKREDFTGHRSPRCRQVFARAEELAASERSEAVGLCHLMQASLEERSAIIERVFTVLRFSRESLEQALGMPERAPAAKPASPETVVEGAEEEPRRARRTKTPLLDQLGRDLTALAHEGRLGPTIGRREEMRRVAQILAQRQKPNPLLIGEAGVGKTCIVEGLAMRAVHPEAPPPVRDLRLIEISMTALVAGTKYRGEFEERLQKLIEEASSDPNIVLFIDEIHTMVGAGKAEGVPMDAGDILKPALARGAIRVIGATTIAEYRRHIETDAALTRRFETVMVEEPTEGETLEILQGVQGSLEEHHRVSIADNTLKQAVALSIRYLPDLRLPDKAISLVDEACARAMLPTLSPIDAAGRALPRRADRPRIEAADIARVVSARCRVPLEDLTADGEANLLVRARLLTMEMELLKRVIGQDHAVREVSETIRTAMAGLQNPRRPKGVFLFLGPTGTGKTELAKALAEFLFHDERSLIHFDMSEFGEKHSVARLLGAPPGYVGYEQEGQLTGGVRTRPYSVILFDEIEKAHPEIWDIFLQIFDEGALTDAKGRQANFKDAIIVLTSNLGAQSKRKPSSPMGIPVDQDGQRTGLFSGERNEGWQAYEQEVLDAVKKALRPELVNRIQKKIVFHPLSQEHVMQVIDKLVTLVNARLSDKRITLELAESARGLLIKKGYSEEYGVREMERTIDTLIVQPLAATLLEGAIAGSRRIRVSAEGERMVFEPVVTTGSDRR